MRTQARSPVLYGSTLNTSPQNGSAGSGLRRIFFARSPRFGRLAFALAFVLRSMPSTGGTSVGLGKYAATASSSGCTPMPCSAEPHSTGWICRCTVASRSTLWISGSGIGSSASASSISSLL